MSIKNGNKVDRHGVRVPSWAPEDADTPDTYAADASGDLRAIVNKRSDGLGYCIETWSESVGLTTFWSAASYDDAVAFADEAVRDGVRAAHTHLLPGGYCRCGLTPVLTPAQHEAHLAEIS